jgi:hypothetical protein
MLSEMRRPGRFATLLVALGALGGCDRGPSPSKLAALRAEANAENDKRAATVASETDREIRDWTLTVEGQTASGAETTVRYPDLDAMATDRIQGPHYTLVQGDERVVIEFVPVTADEEGPAAPRQLELDMGGFVQMELQGLEGAQE